MGYPLSIFYHKLYNKQSIAFWDIHRLHFTINKLKHCILGYPQSSFCHKLNNKLGIAFWDIHRVHFTGSKIIINKSLHSGISMAYQRFTDL